jgi:hypothetical protein
MSNHSSARLTSARPLTQERLVAKFRDCTAHARRPLRAASELTLIDTILNLEQVGNLESPLFTLLRDFEC